MRVRKLHTPPLPPPRPQLPRVRAARGRAARAAVLPVPGGGGRPEADHHHRLLVPRDVHAVDPGGDLRGPHAHGAH